MKAKALIIFIITIIIVSLNLLYDPDENYTDHLEELSEHWKVNKSSFDELVTIIQSLGDNQPTSITIGDAGTLLLPTSKDYTLNVVLKSRIIELMERVNIFRIRISPSVITFSEFNSAIGDNLNTMLRLTSSYMYYLKNVTEVSLDKNCNDIKMPPKSTTACDLILNDNWVIAHSIIILSGV
jgi:hypothetical protein